MTTDDKLEGFLQCLSQVFRVKQDYIVLLKLTMSPVCFCSEHSYHILIRWNDKLEDAGQQRARIQFLDACTIHQWIRVSGLRKSKIYSGQTRERVVWLFQANSSRLQHIAAPEGPRSLYLDSCCLPQPVGMLSTFHAIILSVHCHGRILELTDLDSSVYSSSESSVQVPVYWCLSSCLLNTTDLQPGAHVVLHNLWYLPIMPCMGKPIRYEALLVLGVYSTCRLTRPAHQLVPFFPHPSCPCVSLCCTDPRLAQPESLNPINVRALLFCCLLTVSCNATLEHADSADPHIRLEQFQIDILDRLSSFDPIYQPQFTEEFINFPFLYGKASMSDLFSGFALTVAQLLDAFNSMPTSGSVGTTSRRVQLELVDQKSFLICNQQIRKKPLDLIGPNRWIWSLEDAETKLKNSDSTDAGCSSDSWSTRSFRVLLADQSTTSPALHQHQQQASPVVIGRLAWTADEACYHISGIPLSSLDLWPTTISTFTCSAEDVSIPLLLKSSQWTRKPLPRKQSIVALFDCVLLCKSERRNCEPSQSHDPRSITPELYLTAKQLIVLEPDRKLQLRHRFENLSMPSNVRKDTIRLIRIGTASSGTTASTVPQWSFPITVQLEPSQTSRSFLLTGSVARCWYWAFERGMIYHFHWQWTEDADIARLISVQPVSPTVNSPECAHLMRPQDALILAQSRSHKPDCPVITVHLQGVLVHQTMSDAQNWCLWCAQIDRDSSITDSLSTGSIPHMVCIHIPPELDWTQWLEGFPGPMCWIRVYDLHWVRLCSRDRGSVQLVASTLSRIEWVSLLDPWDSSSPNQQQCFVSRLAERDCPNCRALWALTTRDEVTISSGWISPILPSGDDGLDPNHWLSVRARIIKCLEFQCDASDHGRSATTAASASQKLQIHMRFLINDGSGCALVQLGQPRSFFTGPGSFTSLDSVDENQSPCDTVEMARHLFCMDPSNWRRFCVALKHELSGPWNRHPGGFLSVHLKSVDGSQQCSPLQYALRAFLTSPTFLRVHRLVLERLSWKSAGGMWRLRHTRIQGTTDEGNPTGGTGVTVRFSVPPPQLFNLVRVETDF